MRRKPWNDRQQQVQLIQRSGTFTHGPRLLWRGSCFWPRRARLDFRREGPPTAAHGLSCLVAQKFANGRCGSVAAAHVRDCLRPEATVRTRLLTVSTLWRQDAIWPCVGDAVSPKPLHDEAQVVDHLFWGEPVSQQGGRTKRKIDVAEGRVSEPAKPTVPSRTLSVSGARTGRPTTDEIIRDPTTLDTEEPMVDATTQPCCCRFQFADGFLLDSLAGQLWR